MADRDAIIVWNEGRTEGVVFLTETGEDTSHPFYRSAEQDANEASTGEVIGGVGSSLACAFYETYEWDDERPIERVTIRG